MKSKLVSEALGDVLKPHSEEELDIRRQEFLVKDPKDLQVYSAPHGNTQTYSLLDDGDGEWREDWQYLGFDNNERSYAFMYDEGYDNKINIFFISEENITTNVMEDQ